MAAYGQFSHACRFIPEEYPCRPGGRIEGITDDLAVVVYRNSEAVTIRRYAQHRSALARFPEKCLRIPTGIDHRPADLPCVVDHRSINGYRPQILHAALTIPEKQAPINIAEELLAYNLTSVIDGTDEYVIAAQRREDGHRVETPPSVPVPAGDHPENRGRNEQDKDGSASLRHSEFPAHAQHVRHWKSTSSQAPMQAHAHAVL